MDSKLNNLNLETKRSTLSEPGLFGTPAVYWHCILASNLSCAGAGLQGRNKQACCTGGGMPAKVQGTFLAHQLHLPR
eukprot:1160661-Pelagomonas_calceolata.AAC.2